LLSFPPVKLAHLSYFMPAQKVFRLKSADDWQKLRDGLPARKAT